MSDTDIPSTSLPLTSGLVPLSIDSSTDQLSGKPPKEIAHDAKRIQAQDFLCWGVRADIIAVHQGTYNSAPATLLVFEFRFEFPDAAGSKNRLREAKIVATFRPPPSAKKHPIVRIICPKLIEGPATLVTHTRETSKAVSLNLKVEPIPVGAEASVSRTKAVAFERDQKLSIRGTRWSSKEVEDDDIDNVARWIMTENSALGKGIPPEFRCAVVVENHEAAVCGTVKISAQTKSGLSLFGWPWADTKPIVVGNRVMYGHMHRVGGSLDFKKFGDAKWEELCEFEGEKTTCRWT